MDADGYQDVCDVAIEPMTEAEMADSRRQEGFATTLYKGHYWEKSFHGFYQPIHTLARLKAAEVGRPALFCWGFRSTLDQAEQPWANGSMPVHLLTGLANYDIGTLPGKRRTDLRKCRRLVQIVRLTQPDILQAQGHEVAASARQRTGYDFARYVGKDQYGRFVEGITGERKYVVLAGLVGDKLAGYMIGFAVGRAGYFKSVEIASEYLPTAIGTGLVFEFVQVCRRSGVVGEILYGQQCPEDRGLEEFKTGMGFPAAQVPCRVWLPGAIKSLIRWRQPAKYNRLMGTPQGEPSGGGTRNPGAEKPGMGDEATG